MDTDELIQAISKKDVEVDEFVQLAISDVHARDEIINQMLTNPDIMVYYHCYYVVSKASEDKPELFLRYWDEMASLLDHKNFYHRDFALTMIANLTRVDHDNLFAKIFESYLAHINDIKFMTGKCCIQNSLKIITNKPELKDQIITRLLDVDNQCTYPDKQRELLNFDILEILDEVYTEDNLLSGMDEFIRACANSISPKTRRKARDLALKHGLLDNSLV
jgi:hypothetical protein